MGRWAFLADPDLVRFLLGGLALTLAVAAGAILLSTVLGTGLALLRLSSHGALRRPALVYIEIVRSLPSFLVVVYTSFAFGRLGLELSVPVSVILGLSLYAASQTAEIIRAGVLSVECGQIEAAQASGLIARQPFLVIVLPQAVRRMAPALASQFVTLTKSTSYGAVIGLHEVLQTPADADRAGRRLRYLEDHAGHVGAGVVLLKLFPRSEYVEAHRGHHWRRPRRLAGG